MGGALDSSRFKYYLSKALNANPNEVEGFVIGGHGDTTMIPMKRFATLRGVPVTEFLSAEETRQDCDRHYGRRRNSHKTSRHICMVCSRAAAAEVVEAVIHDRDAVIPCSALLEGEYGESDLCIGVPCVLGKGGIKRIIESQPQRRGEGLFKKSAEAVHKTNAALPC